MDNSNQRPTDLGREPAVDTGDWRTQLLPGARRRVVNKILETLEKHLPCSSLEIIIQLREIAARFEEKVYTSAESEMDYLRKISLKMLSMERKFQGNPVNNDNLRPTRPYRESAMATGDWRAGLPSDLRPQVINKILETLKEQFPSSSPESVDDLRLAAAALEEEYYSLADSLRNYLHEMAMLLMPKP